MHPTIGPRTSHSTKLFKTPTRGPSTFAVSFLLAGFVKLVLKCSTDLQVLQWWTEEFVRAITSSLSKMPYGMRYMARETLDAVKVQSFPSFGLQSTSHVEL